MNPAEYYRQILTDKKAKLSALHNKKAILGWLRFLSIAGIASCWYFFMPFGIWFVIIPGVMLLAFFARLILLDLQNKSAIEMADQLITINENELKALNHNYHHFADGNEFIYKEHFYTNDLDIFGHASLYQYINRTCSEMGNSRLAGWLSAPANTAAILNRQEAIKELVPQTNWRQQLQAVGLKQKIKTETLERLENWFTQKEIFPKPALWKLLSYIVPAIIISVLALNIAGELSNITRNYFLLASAVLAFYISKRVTSLHQQLSKMTDELAILSGSIEMIETAGFRSDYLQGLQAAFNSHNGRASTKISSLNRILERLDLRFNFVVFIPLDILLQWDLHQAIALEKWKRKNHENVISWFSTLGEFEAVSSLATLSFNNPDWCFPVFKENHFYIEGTGIGHPLINTDICVTNPLKLEQAGDIMLVTGSNMAGKSTYLRSIGINCILAMAGAPVYAGYFCLSPIQLISSMRITDNLEENTSTFYAELKKLKAIITKVNNNEKIFILLDEILRGTNSIDRHTGSAALIKQLIKHHAACIIATHDIELAKLKNDYPANIMNFHFDVQINHDELFFDYKLKEGICTNLNASILMKQIGIEL